MDGVRVGDERICRVALKLICEGDTLRFDYTGTSVQVDAAVNSTARHRRRVRGTAVQFSARATSTGTTGSNAASRSSPWKAAS